MLNLGGLGDGVARLPTLDGERTGCVTAGLLTGGVALGLFVGGRVVGPGELSAQRQSGITPASGPYATLVGPEARQVGAAPVPGSSAPDFALAQLDGGEVRLSEFHGPLALINFWAS